MQRRHDFCPKCQGIRSMSVSVSLRTTVTPQGSKEELIYNLHCDTCRGFVGRFVAGGEEERRSSGFIELRPSLPVS